MTSKTKTPKSRNLEKTKAKILSCAQKSFAERGYAQAGIREIAAQADVSSPLLLRYYGSKARLFEAALMDATQVSELFAIDKKEFGVQLARLLMDSSLDLKPPSILALSTGNDEARAIATKVTAEQVLQPLATWLGPPNGHTRALEIMMLGMGFVLFTRQFPLLGAIQGAENDLADWFAQSVQAIVDKETVGSE